MANLLSPRISFSEFAGQYLVGNVVGLVLAVPVALFVQEAFHSPAVTAIATSATESVAWYIYITLYYARHSSLERAGRDVLTDFGAAEVLDTLLVRPVLLYLMPMLTHNQASGVIAATIVADSVYTIISLNRQRHRRNAGNDTVGVVESVDKSQLL